MNPTGVREGRISRRDLFLASWTTRGVGNCREFIGRESEIVPIVRVIEQIERLENQLEIAVLTQLDVLCQTRIHVEVRVAAQSAVSSKLAVARVVALRCSQNDAGNIVTESITGVSCVPESRFFGAALVTTSAPAILPPPRFNMLLPEAGRNGRAEPNCRIGEASRPNGRCEVPAMVR